MSRGTEYGSAVHRINTTDNDSVAGLMGQTRYFMSHTFSGFQSENEWYTIMNGLFGSLDRAILDSVISFLGAEQHGNVQVRMVGFAHTHPVDSPAYPSTADEFMRRNLSRWPFNMYLFPITSYRRPPGSEHNPEVPRELIINWSW